MRNSELKSYVNSCFNYTGNKYKQLPQLFNLFPKSVDTFVDLFCGGGVVGLNAIKHMNAKQIILNDKSEALISIFKLFQGQDYDTLHNQILKMINDYGLTDTSKYGYKHYGVESSYGLAKINKENFFKLRDDYNNADLNSDYPKPLMLYVLIVFAFNNQIRFNKHKKFNLPVGKRDFNKRMQLKLSNFVNLLHESQITITNQDFSEVKIPNNSFVYCDPPYSITTASYNERKLWTKENDVRLFNLLDDLDKRGIPFALSNVLVHNGLKNEQLAKWSSHYNVHSIDFNYNNSNYQSRVKNHTTQEVVITNY